MEKVGLKCITNKDSQTSIVFVHGFLSDGETCWQNKNGNYWPDLLKEDFNWLNIYVYTYQTSIFSGTYNLGDVVDDLKERMNLEGLFNSKRIVFVCHSMGGIVVRKFIVERSIDLIERNVNIGLFLVASPSLGAKYANLFKALASIAGNSQAQALQFSQKNFWLNNLDKEFLNLKEAHKFVLKGKELIEDKSIFKALSFMKQIVEPFSGARYFGEPYKVPGSDHFSISKPEDNNAIQHRQLCHFIKEIVNGAESGSSSEHVANSVKERIINNLTKLHKIFLGKYIFFKHCDELLATLDQIDQSLENLGLSYIDYNNVRELSYSLRAATIEFSSIVELNSIEVLESKNAQTRKVINMVDQIIRYLN